MVLMPLDTRSAKTSAPSVKRLRRSPFSLSSSGGLRNTTRRGPEEAPSSSTSENGSPVRLSASSCGLAMVALVSTKRGSPPCSSATRLSLRKHRRDVGAEDAAQDVGLVDGHDLEVPEEIPPGLVVRQEADVEHVGVREDYVRAAPDVRAQGLRGVAVVGGRVDAAQAEALDLA
jgi:hypothetical protein